MKFFFILINICSDFVLLWYVLLYAPQIIMPVRTRYFWSRPAWPPNSVQHEHHACPQSLCSTTELTGVILCFLGSSSGSKSSFVFLQGFPAIGGVWGLYFAQAAHDNLQPKKINAHSGRRRSDIATGSGTVALSGASALSSTAAGGGAWQAEAEVGARNSRGRGENAQWNLLMRPWRKHASSEV
jgi:hypothetical protein